MSWRDVVKAVEFTADDDWQNKLQEQLDAMDYDEVEGEEVLKPENKINPMNTEHMMDILIAIVTVFIIINIIIEIIRG